MLTNELFDIAYTPEENPNPTHNPDDQSPPHSPNDKSPVKEPPTSSPNESDTPPIEEPPVPAQEIPFNPKRYVIRCEYYF